MMNQQNPLYGQYMYGQPQPTINTYSTGVPAKKGNTPITEEMRQQLQNNQSALDLRISNIDKYKAICTHKMPGTGVDALVVVDGGKMRCSICGTEFEMFDGDAKEINAVISKIESIFETCKAIYFDAPNEFTEQYYQILPLLKKLPSIYEKATEDFKRYENYVGVGNINPINPGYGTYNAFASINQMMMNPYAMYAPQQPQQAVPVVQPGMMPQYAMPQQAYYGQQQVMMDPNANPMAYGVAQPVPQQQTQNMAPPVGSIPSAPNPNGSFVSPSVQNAEIQQTETFKA